MRHRGRRLRSKRCRRGCVRSQSLRVRPAVAPLLADAGRKILVVERVRTLKASTYLAGFSPRFWACSGATPSSPHAADTASLIIGLLASYVFRVPGDADDSQRQGQRILLNKSTPLIAGANRAARPSSQLPVHLVYTRNGLQTILQRALPWRSPRTPRRTCAGHAVSASVELLGCSSIRCCRPRAWPIIDARLWRTRHLHR